MNVSERLIADYTGTGLTVGPHPLTFRRKELSMRGVLPAIDLPRREAGPARAHRRHGDHAAAARHRQGLRLPHARRRNRHLQHHHPSRSLRAPIACIVVEASFLLVEGLLQNQDGVTSIKAERMSKLAGMPDGAAIDSHDFH